MTAADLITLLSKHPEAPIVFVQGASDALWPVPLEVRHVGLNNEANAWVVDLGARAQVTPFGKVCSVCACTNAPDSLKCDDCAVDLGDGIQERKGNE